METKGQVKGRNLWSTKWGGRLERAGWAKKGPKFKEHIKARIKEGAEKLPEVRKGGWKGNRGQKNVEAKKGWEAEKSWEESKG